MAVDTLRKRSAANRYGMRWLAGTRPPASPLDAFERAALVGCYYLEPAPVVFGHPDHGWTFGRPETVFTFQPLTPVFDFTPTETVFTFQD